MCLGGETCLSVKSSETEIVKIQRKGTVKYVNFEGGFYGIVGDDARNYDPLNMPQEFRVDGLRVRFTAERGHAIMTDNVATFHMWGYIVRLVSIQKL